MSATPELSPRIVSGGDGVPIAVCLQGSGPPLVLVHGGLTDHTTWRFVLPGLAERCAVHAYDRRGRGRSGDSVDYSLEQEVDDLVAVLDAVGVVVTLFGHSLGGLLALEGALRTGQVERLIVYEPGIGGELPGKVDRLDALLEAGDRAMLLETAMRELAGMSDEEIDAMRNSPVWPARLAAAHTIPRELHRLADYQFDPDRFAGLSIPTLVLVGEHDPAGWSHAAAARVAAALPNNTDVTFAGQGHIAHMTAPDLLASEIFRFMALDHSDEPARSAN